MLPGGYMRETALRSAGFTWSGVLHTTHRFFFCADIEFYNNKDIK